jgi:hypothetical protein
MGGPAGPPEPLGRGTMRKLLLWSIVPTLLIIVVALAS